MYVDVLIYHVIELLCNNQQIHIMKKHRSQYSNGFIVNEDQNEVE